MKNSWHTVLENLKKFSSVLSTRIGRVLIENKKENFVKKKQKPHAVKLMNARAAGIASLTVGRSRVFKNKRDKLKRLSWKKVEEQLE